MYTPLALIELIHMRKALSSRLDPLSSLMRATFFPSHLSFFFSDGQKPGISLKRWPKIAKLFISHADTPLFFFFSFSAPTALTVASIRSPDIRDAVCFAPRADRESPSISHFFSSSSSAMIFVAHAMASFSEASWGTFSVNSLFSLEYAIAAPQSTPPSCFRVRYPLPNTFFLPVPASTSSPNFFTLCICWCAQVSRSCAGDCECAASHNSLKSLCLDPDACAYTCTKEG
mmetsp:Transcript_11798/g.23770  ORF Transcript_11798/g.23770 Transcript_11798/m.23770 type:complete len:230 (-) Transcript_11798:1166-1855(-)